MPYIAHGGQEHRTVLFMPHTNTHTQKGAKNVEIKENQ